MARTITPKDAYALMNLLVKEAIGADATIQAVDSSTFVSAGETVLATGTENVLNALSIVLGRTFMAVRPYKAKLGIINAIDTGLYTNRMRKISFYDEEAQATGAWNTDLYTNIKDGFDNGSNPSGGTAQSVGTMWEQHLYEPIEMNFAGQSAWDFSITVPEVQLQIAFRSPDEFAAFISGMMTKHGNDIEKTKEAFNRMTLLNKIAGCYALDSDMPGTVVNPTKAFNDEYNPNGTPYSSEELRTTYIKEFTAFFVEKFKLETEKMTYDTTMYHWTPTSGSKTLSRHTSYADQRVLLYEPLFIKSKAQVLPEIFNPQYLDINTQYEGVMFWQNWNNPSAINVIPAIPDTSNPAQQTAPGSAVTIPYVVGIVYDHDAMMTDFQYESSDTTPLEARKKYRNIWLHCSKNAINDFTENTIIFIMEDPST